MSGQRCAFVHPLGFQCDLKPSHEGLHEAGKAFSVNTSTAALTLIRWMVKP